MDAEEFQQFAMLNQINKRKLISLVILRHIHSIDIDDRALETAKTNIWKEAIKLEKGLFNFRKLGVSYNHILPNLQLNFINAHALFDLPINRQLEILSIEHKQDIKELHAIRNKYFAEPTDPDILFDVDAVKKKIKARLLLEFEVQLSKHPAFICVDFFHLFFDIEGNVLPGDKQGFTGISAILPGKKCTRLLRNL